MGEVGGYVLDLYCDHPRHPPGDAMDQFAGVRNRRDAVREAKDAGWKQSGLLPLRGPTSPPAWVCPKCAPLPVTTPETE